MHNEAVNKFKVDYGYEKVLTDKLKLDYLRTIRFKNKKK